MNPRASVCLTVYNATWCVERAIESVLDQTLPAHEIVVSDDGSTDGTADLVERRFGDRVRVLRLPHRNASATRAIGIAQSTGDWVAFMDADDLWHPDKLERQAAYLERHPEVRWISSDGRYIAAEGVLRPSWLSEYFDPVRELCGDLLPALVERCFTLMSSMMVQRRVYDEVGGLDPDIIYSHDYDLWMRVGARYPGALLAECLIDYWSGPTTLSRDYEGRHRDDLLLMRRVERGQLGRRPDLQHMAAERAAQLEFDIGVACLRSGRTAEGRERLRRAGRRGPLKRRAVAVAGALMPSRMLPRLMRSPWLKDSVTRTRPRAQLITIAQPSEEAT